MIYELRISFREAKISYLFQEHPTKKDITDLLYKIWESLTTEVQDQSFVFLLFPMLIPDDVLWFDFESIYGRAKIRKRGVIDNANKS